MHAYQLRATWEPRHPLTPAQERTRRAPASWVWRGPVLERVELPDPDPGPGEVVVEVGACGVCGSDTHCIETDADGYVLFSGPTRLPVTLGHEYTGRVVALGAGVRWLRVGELVAGEGMLSCGRCEACRRGLPNQCVELDMVGFSAPGAYARYVLAGEHRLWSLDRLAGWLGSAEAALEVGALVEPISCSYNGIWVSAGGMLPGSHVAVYGCGPIGLGAILLARAAGAATVSAFDLVPERVALARALGADVAWSVAELQAAGGTPAGVVRELTDGWGADLHVEAAGAAGKVLPDIEASMAAGGRMVYLGRTGERVPVELDVFVSAAAGIVGARGHAGGGCFPGVIRLLERGRIDVSPMITARLPADAVPEALERSRTRRDGKILVVSG